MQHPYIRRLMMYLALAFVIVGIIASVASGFSLKKKQPSLPTNATTLCSQGDGYACFLIGRHLLFSDKNISDISLARAYYQRACSLRLNEACMEYHKIHLPPYAMYRRYYQRWERDTKARTIAQDALSL